MEHSKRVIRASNSHHLIFPTPLNFMYIAVPPLPARLTWMDLTMLNLLTKIAAVIKGLYDTGKRSSKQLAHSIFFQAQQQWDEEEARGGLTQSKRPRLESKLDPFPKDSGLGHGSTNWVNGHHEPNTSDYVPLPLLSPLLEWGDPVTEVLGVLEYSPLLLYDSLALLESPSSVVFNSTERIPNLPSESVWENECTHYTYISKTPFKDMYVSAECSSGTSLLRLLREDSTHGRSKDLLEEVTDEGSFQSAERLSELLKYLVESWGLADPSRRELLKGEKVKHVLSIYPDANKGFPFCLRRSAISQLWD